MRNKKLSYHLESENYFNNNQFGFRIKYSIGSLISKMRRTIINTPFKYYAVIQTDLSNAFGSSDTELILSKLCNIADEKSFSFFKSFLSQSEGYVYFKQKWSQKFLTSPLGYTQGSCLSPTLFVALMTESHNYVNYDMYSFADDANILVFANNVDDLRMHSKNSVTQFSDFCEMTNIKLNIDKTFYVNNAKINDAIKINNFDLTEKNKSTYLESFSIIISIMITVFNI